VVNVTVPPAPANAPNVGNPAGPVPPPANDLHRDLPRIGQLLDLGVVREEEFPESLRTSKTFRQRAFIGDPRNDENLVVAQFHLGLLRFHNAVVDWLRFKDPHQEARVPGELFEDARRIVRWTFQWLTVNQFLKRLLNEQVLKDVLDNGAPLYHARLRQQGGTYGSYVEPEPYMPVEFSAAAYRFGHSMIRHLYDYNRNFGRKTDAGDPGFVIPNASLDLLFVFTGKSAAPFDPSGGRAQPAPEALPHNWIIEWDRFDGRSPLDGSDGQPARVARKIDTQLAAALGTMLNEGGDAGLTTKVRELLKHLARRNLRRGYQLSLPTGQALARALGMENTLTAAELGQGKGDAVDQALTKGGFYDKTPLWFYILKEAEVREGGERLGELGSRIVAETFIGVLLTDPESYLSQAPDWNPSKPVPDAGGPLTFKDGDTTKTIGTIGDLLRFAGVAV
jgi:hypothetical protein